jgi:uncharacterized paraquat-inducible protein A
MTLADEDLFDEDIEDADFGDDDADADLMTCPNCRAEVHEDTQKCPHCGDWITPQYPGELRKRWIWTAAAVLVVIAFLLMTLI